MTAPRDRGMKIEVWLDILQPYEPRTVAAELLPDLAPHLASVATFTVHQDPYYIAGRRWQVTNVESGRRIGEYYPSRAAAIAGAQAKLRDITVERTQRAYAKCKPGKRSS